MKKPTAKKTARSEQEKRWVQALTVLVVVALVMVVVCVVWRTAK